MLTHGPVPSTVTHGKVLEWTFETPRPEGVHLVTTFELAAAGRANWLLFYCWSYSRTNGFKDPCCKEWDYGKLGSKYDTSGDGARDAFSEFEKYDDTQMMENAEEVEQLYKDCVAWCDGEVHHPPVPEPKPPEPPVPEPQPEPSEPTKPPPPQEGGGFDWRKLLKVAVPILRGILTVAAAFLPGWVKIVLDIVLRVADNVS